MWRAEGCGREMVFQVTEVWREPVVECAQCLAPRWEVAMQTEVLVTPPLCPGQILLWGPAAAAAISAMGIWLRWGAKAENASYTSCEVSWGEKWPWQWCPSPACVEVSLAPSAADVAGWARDSQRWGWGCCRRCPEKRGAPCAELAGTRCRGKSCGHSKGQEVPKPTSGPHGFWGWIMCYLTGLGRYF